MCYTRERFVQSSRLGFICLVTGFLVSFRIKEYAVLIDIETSLILSRCFNMLFLPAGVQSTAKQYLSLLHGITQCGLPNRALQCKRIELQLFVANTVLGGPHEKVCHGFQISFAGI